MSRTSLWVVILISAVPGLALSQGEGARVFGRCVPCHSGNGAGMVGLYPPLISHAPEVLATNREYLIRVLLYGLQGKIEIEGQKTGYDGVMPGHSSLKDEEVAAVLNYVLTSWGNDKLLPKDFKPISAGEVKAERGKNLTRRKVWEIRKEMKLRK